MATWLTNAGYRCNLPEKVWSRPSYAGIAYSDGDAFEEGMLKILENTKDRGLFSRALVKECKDWPSAYHLSPTRANILRPFENQLRERDVLEIGAGCGAISRYLGEIGAHVCALEGSPRRARIARARTADLDNVTVLTENFAAFAVEMKFDVITLVGVLEYAHLFVGGTNPPSQMLKRARAMLKPGGSIFIAIENQLGLKYFAGAHEDHVARRMFGLENRYSSNGVRTYGKEELARICVDSGLSHTQFLAPFPDYKFPQAIITDDGFKATEFDVTALLRATTFSDRQLPNVLSFDPRRVWEVVVRNKLGMDLSNSFLVVAAPDALPPLGNLGWWYSTQRAPHFCKEIGFQRTSEGEIVKLSRLLAPSHGSPCEDELAIDVSAPVPYVRGVPLSDQLTAILSRDGWLLDEVVSFVRQFLTIAEELLREEGVIVSLSSLEVEIPGRYIDLIPQNVIVDEMTGQPRLIDREWIAHQPVKAEWLIFRSLLVSICSMPVTGATGSDAVRSRIDLIESVFSGIGMSISRERIWALGRQEAYLQSLVSGQSVAEDFWKPDSAVGVALERETEVIMSMETLVARYEESLRDAQSPPQGAPDVRERIEGRKVDESQRELIAAALSSVSAQSHEVATQSLILKTRSRPTLRQMLVGLKIDLKGILSLRKRPEFDVAYYAPRLNGRKGGRLLSIIHYQMFGWRQGRNPSPVFDTTWYRCFYKDLGEQCYSPLLHYVRHGALEGRATSERELENQSRMGGAKRPDRRGMSGAGEHIREEVASLRRNMTKDAESGTGISPIEILQKVFDIKGDISETPSVRAPYDEAPEVSIIIPVFNQLRSTLSCIQSLAKHETKVSFEIIVVDDCSTDSTITACQSIPELVVVTKETNSGFIESCNRGAHAARGRKLVFLNNDTYVLPGWLDSLCETLESNPSVGLVGSQLLYPDGTLQEAGGIIWRDGQAWNYGRNQDPARGEFNYVRDVDFCSGASLIIDRELFMSLGCFDPHYAPAYCEDVDLAFKVRERGLRVLYQPFSRIVHFEGVSSGTDVKVGVKAYQVANLRKIKARWAAQLTRHAPSDVAPEVARDYQVKGRVFFVDALTPTPDQDAGSIVTDTWLTALVELGYHVTFFPYWNREYVPHYTERLERLGVHVLSPPTSLDVEKFISRFGSTYDLVIGLRHESANPVFKAFDKCGFRPKKFFLPIDLHYVRELRQADLTGGSVERERALKTKKKELAVAKDSDIIFVHSSYEQEELGRELPDADVRVSPIITDVNGCRNPFEARKDICFVGGFQHTPNIDAVTFFVKEVLPLVNKALPDVVFKIIGSKPPAQLDALPSDNVEVLGFVQDLEPIWSSIRLSVAPLRFGAGVKGKVCMSLSYGVPVVCTPIAAEGMGLQDGKDVLIGATAEELAKQIIRAYTDPELWSALSNAGMTLVEEEFSTATNRKRIERYLADVGLGTISGIASTAA